MKRLARLLAILFGAALLLVAGAAVAVRFLLPPEKAGALLEKQLETRLGREVELGSVRIRGLSTLRVDGIKLSEAPAFSAGTFLTADAFEVTARLLPLIVGKIVVKDVLLDRPKLTVVRGEDGRFNMAGSSSTAAPGSPSTKPADFLISDVRLRSGAVTFVDKSTAALSAVLDPLDVHLSHVSLVSPVRMEGDARVAFRGLDAGVKFEADFDPLKGDAALAKFSVEAASATAEITGRVQNAFGGSPGFNGTLTWQGLDPSTLSKLVPLPEGLSVKGPTTGRLDVSGTAPSVESKFETDFSQADLRWKDIVSKSPGVPFTARMALDRGKTGDLNLHDLVIKLASVELRGGGTLKGTGEDARVASFRVETNEFDVADLFRYVRADLPTGVTLAGPVRASVSLDGWTGGGRIVADFNGTGLSAGYGDSFRKAPGTVLRLVADGRYATPLAVDFSSVRLDLDQLSMSGKGSYTTGKVRPTYVFRVKTNAFPLKTVAALLPVAAPYQPGGQAVVDMRISRGNEGPLIGGSATLLAAAATIQQAAVSDLSGKLDFTNDSVSTAKLTGRLQGDPLQMSLRATRLKGRPLIEADVRATKLDLAKLLPEGPKKTELPARFRWAPLPASVADAAETTAPFIFDTKGSLRATVVTHPDYSGQDLQLDWDLKSVTSEMGQMTGKARLRHGRGRAKNLRTLIDSSKTARLILGPLSVLQLIDKATGGALKIPLLENFDFTSIAGDYAMKDGVTTLAPMVIDAPALNSRAEGTVGLAGAQPLNLRMIVTVRADMLQGAMGQALAALGGDTQTLKMTVTGTVDDPKVSVDKGAVQQKVNDSLKKLGKDIFKQLSR